MMNIRIAIDEIESRRKVKAAGGKWDPKRKVWQLPYEKVRGVESNKSTNN